MTLLGFPFWLAVLRQVAGDGAVRHRCWNAW